MQGSRLSYATLSLTLRTKSETGFMQKETWVSFTWQGRLPSTHHGSSLWRTQTERARCSPCPPRCQESFIIEIKKLFLSHNYSVSSLAPFFFLPPSLLPPLLLLFSPPFTFGMYALQNPREQSNHERIRNICLSDGDRYRFRDRYSYRESDLSLSDFSSTRLKSQYPQSMAAVMSNVRELFLVLVDNHHVRSSPRTTGPTPPFRFPCPVI